MKIEELWLSLRDATASAQLRVDSTHPLDLYADFDPPNHPGLVLFCPTCPPDFRSLNAIRIERLQRSDSRWSLRILLEDPRLMTVFVELCRDIIEFTRSGVESQRSGAVVLSRIERWRSLLSVEPTLSTSRLRGLIGELLILESLLPQLGPDDAVAAWTGPFGTAQDFRLPSGRKIEVKAVVLEAKEVLINGLDQLDSGGDPLSLKVVRLEDTGRQASGAITARVLVEKLRIHLADYARTLELFDSLLLFLGWDNESEYDQVAVRLLRIDEFKVGPSFPRLIAETVPVGIADATYKIVLPPLEMTDDD